MAVAYMHVRGGLSYIKNGRIEDAILKLHEEWAALPPHEQSHVTLEYALSKFNEYYNAERKGITELKTPQGKLIIK